MHTYTHGHTQNMIYFSSAFLFFSHLLSFHSFHVYPRYWHEVCSAVFRISVFIFCFLFPFFLVGLPSLPHLHHIAEAKANWWYETEAFFISCVGLSAVSSFLTLLSLFWKATTLDAYSLVVREGSIGTTVLRSNNTKNEKVCCVASALPVLMTRGEDTYYRQQLSNTRYDSRQQKRNSATTHKYAPTQTRY